MIDTLSEVQGEVRMECLQENRQGVHGHGRGNHRTIMGREGDMWDVVVGCVGIPLLSGFFRSGIWDVQVFAKCHCQCLESLVRNKHNGFSLEHQLSSLAYFWL